MGTVDFDISLRLASFDMVDSARVIDTEIDLRISYQLYCNISPQLSLVAIWPDEIFKLFVINQDLLWDYLRTKYHHNTK